MLYVRKQEEASVTVTSADVWDGKLTHDTLAETVAADQAEAIHKSKDWANSLKSFPDGATLRVKINGVITSVPFEEFWHRPRVKR
jgi:hypothetical protein